MPEKDDELNQYEGRKAPKHRNRPVIPFDKEARKRKNKLARKARKANRK